MTSRLVYEGSVKNLWELPSDKLEFEYTDAYSVFDWGRMPDQLARKGESLAALGAHFFEELGKPETWQGGGLSRSPQLAGLRGELGRLVRTELETLGREGLAHHFIERSHPDRLLVKRVAVFAPEEHKLGAQALYRYSGRGWDESGPRLIPLEVVFRFGLPKGSSFFDRLTPEYAAAHELSKLPKEGEKLEHPIVEFFSKLEETDRFLTWEQALNYSGLTYRTFEKLVARTLALAAWLAERFGAVGLELWDGKFEWAVDGDRLLLVDSIGPDELRLLDPKSGTQISKEFLRLFYRRTPWFEATKAAKTRLATEPGLDWKAAVVKSAGGPPPLSKEYREAADALYPSLARALTGENPGGLALPLPTLLEKIQRCLAP